MLGRAHLIRADVRRPLPLADGSVHCVVTSPPYYALRDYGDPRQIGLEPTPDAYVARMVAVFREVRRVLRDDGTLWLNIGDSYGGDRGNKSPAPDSKNLALGAGSVHGHAREFDARKQLIGIPWRLALALQSDGWYLRSDCIWAKPNPMPESVTDRPTKAHEYVFLLTKRGRYYYDAAAERVEAASFGRQHASEVQPPKVRGYSEGTGNSPHRGTLSINYERQFANLRTVWNISTRPFSGTVKTSRLARVAIGGLSGDTKHKVSSDCPLHGSSGRRDSTPECGGHGADSSTCIACIDDRPDRARTPDSSPTPPTDGPSTSAQSSDSPSPPCSPTATPRSNQTRRTDPGPLTSPPCTLSARTDNRTECRRAGRESSEPCPGTPENNTAAAGSADSPSNRKPDGTGHIPLAPELIGASVESLVERGCTCQFYQEVAEKTSHFACFPPELPARCIRLGTSERGCCPACGAPHRRVTAKERRPTRPGIGSKAIGLDAQVIGNRDPARHVTEARTVGWEPGCGCDAGGPVPCVVLDPFSGSGTTAAVARELGRIGIGTEVNADYLALARDRVGRPAIGRDNPSLAGAAPAAPMPGQLSFFP